MIDAVNRDVIGRDIVAGLVRIGIYQRNRNERCSVIRANLTKTSRWDSRAF